MDELTTALTDLESTENTQELNNDHELIVQENNEKNEKILVLSNEIENMRSELLTANQCIEEYESEIIQLSSSNEIEKQKLSQQITEKVTNEVTEQLNEQLKQEINDKENEIKDVFQLLLDEKISSLESLKEEKVELVVRLELAVQV